MGRITAIATITATLLGSGTAVVKAPSMAELEALAGGLFGSKQYTARILTLDVKDVGRNYARADVSLVLEDGTSRRMTLLENEVQCRQDSGLEICSSPQDGILDQAIKAYKGGYMVKVLANDGMGYWLGIGPDINGISRTTESNPLHSQP